MKRGFSTATLLLISMILFSRHPPLSTDSLKWHKLIERGYTVYFTSTDNNGVKKLNAYLRSGIDHTTRFFNQQFEDTFNVYIFPERSLLDKQWQQDWREPAFRSECWMIAVGVAHRLDILSPNAWAGEACDHNANDSMEIRQVIWHELVHVFHGQINPDHTFSYIENLDWLVEGLSTYVSGLLDEKRYQPVRQLIIDNKTPASLDGFWKGQNKYELSGSMVAFIDHKYGRKKLLELLQQTNKTKVLESLAISETQLLSEWKRSFE